VKRFTQLDDEGWKISVHFWNLQTHGLRTCVCTTKAGVASSNSKLQITEVMTPASKQDVHKKALPDESLAEPLDSLGIELSRISAEIQSINSGFQAQMQQVLADNRAMLEKQYEARVDQCIDELRERMRVELRSEIQNELRQEMAKRTTHTAQMTAEVERINREIELVGEEITKMLDDPSVELSKVMRKHTKQAELKAYLDGLRFAINKESDSTL